MIGGRCTFGLAGWLLVGALSAAQAAPAEWPEELGREQPSTSAVAQDVDHGSYVEALALLEPGPRYDVEAGRRALASLAASRSSFAARARYALAWLDEHEGSDDRAEGGYVRLIVDEPGIEAGLRARIGFARLLLRRDQPGPAARWLQEAIEGQPSLETLAGPLRELATRSVTRGGPVPPTAVAARRPTGLRQVVGLVAGPRGGAVFADAKAGRVVELDAAGVLTGAWDLQELEALTGDATGRVFAAAGGAIYRLDPGGRTMRRASTGAFAPVGALAADALGRLWILARKGRRIGCLSPGQVEPEPCWESDAQHLVDIVWDGRRLLGTDSRSRRVVAVGREVLPLVQLEQIDGFRPSMLAVDGAGSVAVLDERRGTVTFVRRDGRPAGEFPVAPEAEVERIALGTDGTLHAFDARDGTWIRRP